jgi:photosystem II stability/assembly factor-like uncharacterized protein
MRRTLVAALFFVPTLATAQRKEQPEQRPVPGVADTLVYARLKYRYIGPEGNRISTVTGVIGNPNVIYAGAASGGIFKSTDGGIHWTPIFDNQPVASVGALMVAPSDPNVVWAGTGEPFIRSHISLGWGVFKSLDAGKTWTRMGLENTGRISRVVIDPRDPDRVYVAALGHLYGPQAEKGVYRTIDGGRNWEKVLFVNDSSGANELVMDPTNPRVLYATFWQMEIHTWGRTSGGAGSGIWKSTDGGTTWKRLTGNGLPTKPVGKINLTVSKTNPNRIYALIETGDGVPLPDGKPTDRGRLFRSDDAGTSWKRMSSDLTMAGRTHYYNRLTVSPDNENEVYFVSADFSKTLDGGEHIVDIPFAQWPGGDHHEIWIDPSDGNRMLVSHDGGVSMSYNRGRTWNQVQLPVAQMYHVTIDNKIPYNVYGNRQDGPSAMGPSNARTGGDSTFPGIPRGMWRTVGGGESGWATPDTVDGNLVWSSASGTGSVGGIVTRYDLRNNVSHMVEVWPQYVAGAPADSARYRFVWNAPLTLSAHDHNRIYVGSQHVHVSTDSGVTWHTISPDLTRNDKSKQQVSGGLTPDNIGVEYAGVIFSIAESPLDGKILWAGSNDGLVHVTRDGGTTWTNVTANVPTLWTWGTISSIAASRFDAGTAYITVDGHQANNRDPWVYKTTDYGKTWRAITTGLAHTPLSYAHVVIEDPVRRGMLYLGLENGLFVSFDDGGHWQPLQTNLPHVPVYGLVVQPHFNDLVVATYGRGFWILDDITPLRAFDGDVATKDAYLFKPRTAYRFRDAEGIFAVAYDPSSGFNPPYGAAINYWLKTGSDSVVKDSAGVQTVTRDSITITIKDASGAVVRTMKGPTYAGINRVYWDLRGDPTPQGKLRTSPLYADWMPVGLDGKNTPSFGRISLLMPPATYTVTIAARGQTLSQPLEVKKDPLSGGSEEGIRANADLVKSIQHDMSDVVQMVNSLELTRGRLQSLTKIIEADSAKAESRKPTRTAIDSLDAKLERLEEKLFQRRITGRGQDDVRWSPRLAEQLEYLAGSVSGSDYAPTASQREVAQLLHERTAAVRTEFNDITARELAAINEQLRRAGLDVIGG